MLICISDVLNQQNIQTFRDIMARADWVDGRATAGAQSSMVKNNEQIPENSPVSHDLGERVLEALSQSPLFISAAIPNKIFPPLFNRYSEGHSFGSHVDNAIRGIPRSPIKIRTDLSCTLFISDPDEYDGGELVIEDNAGSREIKLKAGDLVLYPSTSVHHVKRITRGQRCASFFWLQSAIRDNQKRALLFDLDQAIQSLSQSLGVGHPECVRLSGAYHNLLRKWADI